MIARNSLSAMPDIYQRLIDKLNEERQGWGALRQTLFDLSDRWKWWSWAMLYKEIPTIPYPKKDFALHFDSSAPPYRLIEACVKPFPYDRNAFENLVDFLLYGFGDSDIKSIQHIPGEQIKHFNDTLDLGIFYRYPGDYWGHYLEMGMSHSMRSGTGFFSTPPSVCQMMVEMTIPDDPNNITRSFCDPCAGTMRMGLFASNKNLIMIYGMEVAYSIHKIAKLNAFLYLPPSAMPCKEIESKLEALKSKEK